MNKTYGIAMIGAGARGKSYSEAWRQTDAAELVSIADIDAKRAAEYRETYGYAHDGTDYREAIEREDVDIVTVCTPAATHPEIAVYAMNHGKHVICEKPMALSLASAREMMDAEKKNNVMLAMGFQYRYGAKYRKYKQLIDKQLVGTPFAVVFNDFRAIRTVCGKPAMHDAVAGNGGPFVDMLCHMTDLMRWYTGSEPVRVNANLFSYGKNRPELTDLEYLVGNHQGEMKKIEIIAPDTGSVTVEFASNDILTVNMCWGLPPDKDGGGAFDMIGPEGHMNGAKLEDVPLSDPPGDENQDACVIRDFLDALAGGTRPRTGGQDGLAALAVSLAAVKSSAQKRVVSLAEIHEEQPALIDLLK